MHTRTVDSVMGAHACILVQRLTYMLLRDIYHCRLTEAYAHKQGHFHAKTHVA